MCGNPISLFFFVIFASPSLCLRALLASTPFHCVPSARTYSFHSPVYFGGEFNFKVDDNVELIVFSFKSLIENHVVWGKILNPWLLAGRSGYGFYIAYPTFEGYEFSNIWGHICWLVPWMMGRGRHPLLFFIIIPTYPFYCPILSDFSHFHLSPLIRYTIKHTCDPKYLAIRRYCWS